MGSLDQSFGVVQPQAGVTWAISKGALPVFLKRKVWFTFSPIAMVPKRHSVESKVITGTSLSPASPEEGGKLIISAVICLLSVLQAKSSSVKQVAKQYFRTVSLI
jgi:hypothetical protein